MYEQKSKSNQLSQKRDYERTWVYRIEEEDEGTGPVSRTSGAALNSSVCCTDPICISSCFSLGVNFKIRIEG